MCQRSHHSWPDARQFQPRRQLWQSNKIACPIENCQDSTGFWFLGFMSKKEREGEGEGEGERLTDCESVQRAGSHIWQSNFWYSIADRFELVAHLLPLPLPLFLSPNSFVTDYALTLFGQHSDRRNEWNEWGELFEWISNLLIDLESPLWLIARRWRQVSLLLLPLSLSLSLSLSVPLSLFLNILALGMKTTEFALKCEQ